MLICLRDGGLMAKAAKKYMSDIRVMLDVILYHPLVILMKMLTF